MYKPFLHIFFTLLFSLPLGEGRGGAFAQQNLVPNPSFEDFTQCPEHREDLESLVAWYSPSTGTPDIHHSCINGLNNEEVPQNGFGWQWPRTGDAYMGIIVALTGENEYREYVQCELLEPLANGERYRVQFFISRADSSTKACDKIGVFLSDFPISSATNTNLPVVPQLVSLPHQPMSDRVNWVSIEGTIVALGGEKFLTIGVFSDNANTDWVEVDGGWEDEAHYYLDDVSVFQVGVSSLPTVFTPNGDGSNDLFSLSFLDFAEGELRVFDRWGRLSFITTGSVLEWDGRTDGGNASEGVYYFIAVLTNSLGKEIVRKGSVHLLR